MKGIEGERTRLSDTAACQILDAAGPCRIVAFDEEVDDGVDESPTDLDAGIGLDGDDAVACFVTGVVSGCGRLRDTNNNNNNNEHRSHSPPAVKSSLSILSS